MWNKENRVAEKNKQNLMEPAGEIHKFVFIAGDFNSCLSIADKIASLKQIQAMVMLQGLMYVCMCTNGHVRVCV